MLIPVHYSMSGFERKQMLNLYRAHSKLHFFDVLLRKQQAARLDVMQPDALLSCSLVDYSFTR